ncbi:hypothetical protein [Streptomyces uncialis]|uniref:hypothetical protein n=1 Tax=Streptomyces uncialis TaxID=1048205 RepID=UPI002256D8CC|nr:hypothetical protein [Streptomyces uncialis]MCX4661502.1 hypothetical protein [Streptomyces uncialis]
MSKPNKKRYKLSLVRAQYAEAVGGETVEMELNNGEIVTFPHPLFADDEWAARVDEAQNNGAKARAILGEDQYEQLRAAGNEDVEVSLTLMALNEDSQGQLKKRPTLR